MTESGVLEALTETHDCVEAGYYSDINVSPSNVREINWDYSQWIDTGIPNKKARFACPGFQPLSETSAVLGETPLTMSGRYLCFNRRQATTKNAVRGMARIMPNIPLRAVPQKNMAMMMTIGCRPVRWPMIRGVRP